VGGGDSELLRGGGGGGGGGGGAKKKSKRKIKQKQQRRKRIKGKKGCCNIPFVNMKNNKCSAASSQSKKESYWSRGNGRVQKSSRGY